LLIVLNSRNASGRRDPSCPYRQFERIAIAGQLGEEVDGPGDLCRVELVTAPVVVAGSHALRRTSRRQDHQPRVTGG
jgi:hypothetical protein